MYGDTKISFHHESNSSLEKQNTHHKIEMEMFLYNSVSWKSTLKNTRFLSDIYFMLRVGEEGIRNCSLDSKLLKKGLPLSYLIIICALDFSSVTFIQGQIFFNHL